MIDVDGIRDALREGHSDIALAALRPGEVVVGLGAGAGFDALIAARQVGPAGRVIGVGMTTEMLERARENAAKMREPENVEFRAGLVEDLPVASNSADVVISNCVINLSRDKPAVFREMLRVLKPGGRIALCDICLSETLPAELAHLATAYIACVAGAALEGEYVDAIRAAGFADIEFSTRSAPELVQALLADSVLRPALQAIGVDRVRRAAASVRSIEVRATKPMP